MDQFQHVNGIQLHYLEHAGDAPTLVFLPGLTANAHSFDGLMQAGLRPRFRVLALDLRGRGLSDKPETGYTMADHATDVIGFLDALELPQVVMCGHSFGGLLAMYLAANFPDRVAKLVIIDAALGIVSEQARALIRPSLQRLGKRVASWEAYLAAMKAAPQFDGWWDGAIESHFCADVEWFDDGSVQPRSRPEHIAQAIDRAGEEDWEAHVAAITQPALLLHAPGPCGPPGTPPLVPLALAQTTIEKLARCRYHEIPGNHFTMIYGLGAQHIVAAITAFLRDNEG